MSRLFVRFKNAISVILSILIPTLPKRAKLLNNLLTNLYSQISVISCEIEILHSSSPESVGIKRQQLLEQAKGDYIVFFDDDDKPAHNYVSSIYDALQTKPDVVGFYGWITTNGKHQKQFKLSKDCQYVDVPGGHERFNNHLCPVKREIALAVGYKDMTYQEDYDYACRLKESGLIQTEVFINKHLYHYLYVTRK